MSNAPVSGIIDVLKPIAEVQMAFLGSEKPQPAITSMPLFARASLWMGLLESVDLALAPGAADLDVLELQFQKACQAASTQTGVGRTEAFLTISDLLTKAVLGRDDNPWTGTVFRLIEEPGELSRVLMQQLQRTTAKLRQPVIRFTMRDRTHAACRLPVLSELSANAAKPLTIHIRIHSDGSGDVCIASSGNGVRHAFLEDTPETRLRIAGAIAAHITAWRETVRDATALLALMH